MVAVGFFDNRIGRVAATTAESSRLLSLDIARGLVVAIMALDHTRMFFTDAGFDPVDLAHTTPAYFFTRWITHLCAPWFFVIAGLGAGLQRDRGGAVTKFLLARGVWLIAIELTLLGVFWSFTFGWWWFGVIASLGASFLLLAALSHRAPSWILAGAAVLILGGPVIETITPAHGSVAQFFKLFYSGGLMQTGLFGPRIVLFPVLPWFALMALGFGASPFFFRDGAVQRGRLLITGAVLLALFLLLRLTGLYGEAHAPALNSWLAFLDVQKYPPSLHFSLLETGLLALTLAAFAGLERGGRLAALRYLAPYGKAPFAFYCAHIFLIHALALLTAKALGWNTAYLFWTRVGPNLRPPPGYGFDLPGVYAAWLLVLALLYPLCLWVTRLKRDNPRWWLRYL